MERLQNILSHAGVASRRHAAEMIESGRVTVDGLVVKEAGARFEPGAVEIKVDGRKVEGVERPRTIMLYKPVGVVSTLNDPFGEKTVGDLIKGQVSERLVPVGRLDKDSEGLMLMSNDGALVNRLTHPRFEHEKIYEVKVAGRWSEEKLATLRGSVEMPDGYRTRQCKVEPKKILDNNTAWLEFTLKEGRKRQIRYMCSAAHLVVTSLKRIAMGCVRLDKGLKPGEWRDLTQAELEALQ